MRWIKELILISAFLVPGCYEPRETIIPIPDQYGNWPIESTFPEVLAELPEQDKTLVRKWIERERDSGAYMPEVTIREAIQYQLKYEQRTKE